jgi:hypothetical protein
MITNSPNRNALIAVNRTQIEIFRPGLQAAITQGTVIKKKTKKKYSLSGLYMGINSV